MIYTVTFNPSLDYIVTLDQLRQNSVNRTETEKIYPGGKGINVSIVLSNLGIRNKALGFVSGFTGTEIIRRLTESGVNTDFINTGNGLSRINVKIREVGNDNISETELNGQGSEITADCLRILYSQLDAMEKGDILTLAGSIPKSMPQDIYERIMQRLADKDIQVIVDATNRLLLNTLEYRPFLIKPNNIELGEIFGTELNTFNDVIDSAKRIQKMGARNVLVSMAEKGAVMVTEKGECFKRPAYKGNLINSVGAGDSMVAGFIAGWLKTKDYRKAFELSVATGSASAFSEWLAEKRDVEALLPDISEYIF